MNKLNFDFSLFYRQRFSDLNQFKVEKHYDLFISAYNDSERVQRTFAETVATSKHWLVFPEYRYELNEIPEVKEGEHVFKFEQSTSEGEIIRTYLESAGISFSRSLKICIDITGFIRPHLIFLVRYLSSQYDIIVDFIYTDPIKYVKKEQTDFSSEYITVRQIEGCQGIHSPATHNDHLIICAGYDNMRITDVSKSKATSKKTQLFGFPSLQPDMYQENILKAYISEEATSNGRESFIDPSSTIFAPANDPFVTANVIKAFIQAENKKNEITNLYLCPLSTKAQTLGVALYYIANCLETNASIIFPTCERYSRETTEGISKIWRYTVDFSALKSLS